MLYAKINVMGNSKGRNALALNTSSEPKGEREKKEWKRCKLF